MNIIVKMIFGSHLYGTSSEVSDTDYKGIFLPEERDILLGTVPKSISFNSKKDSSGKNTSEDIDNEIYSLNYFLKLALEGQTVAIDMLHAPDNMILERDEYNIWDYLVNHRHEFYTKDLKAFVGYARKQAAKYSIKGSRLSAAQIVMESLEEFSTYPHINILGDVWNDLPKGEHIHFTEPDRYGNIFYQVCGKKLGKTVKLLYAFNVIKKFYDEYGKRAQLAAENKSIDFKAVSHAIRAAYQVKEILVDKTVTFPLKEAEFILKVKNGELDYNTVVAPALENLMDEVEELSLNSDLPSKPNYKYWEEWLCFILKDKVICRRCYE